MQGHIDTSTQLDQDHGFTAVAVIERRVDALATLVAQAEDEIDGGWLVRDVRVAPVDGTGLFLASARFVARP